MKRKKTSTKSSIEFNKVTSLSKTLAFILFIGLPILAFALGMRYQSVIGQYDNVDIVTIEVQHRAQITPEVPPPMRHTVNFK